MSRRAAALTFACAVVVVGCSSDLPSRPDAHRTTTTTTTSTTTTSTTTTTLPPILVPGPVKAGAVCLVPNGVSTTADNVGVRCLNRKSFDAKPFSGGRFRWVPSAT